MRGRPAFPKALILGALFALYSGSPLRAATQPGEFTLRMDFGESSAPNDNSYSSSETLGIALQYHKTKVSSFRGSAGFMTLDGREPISPAAGTRDADVLYVEVAYIATLPNAMVHPYAVLGIDFYSVRLIDNLDTPQSLEFGGSVGAGLGIQLADHFEIGGEIQWHFITGDISTPVQKLTVFAAFHF